MVSRSAPSALAGQPGPQRSARSGRGRLRVLLPVFAAALLGGCAGLTAPGGGAAALPEGVSRDQLLTDIAACHVLRVLQNSDRAVTDAVVIAAVERYGFEIERMVQRANDLTRVAAADPASGPMLRSLAQEACERLAALTGHSPGLVRFEPSGEIGRTWLVVSGVIGDGFAEDVIARLRAERAVGLVLNSPGGSLGEARTLGRWLRENGFPVGVDQLCTSACIDVLAGGVERYVTADARLGIHQSKVPGHLSSHEGGQLSVVSAALYLREMGVDESVALAAAATPNDRMYWISLAEALETGLATKVVEGF